MQLDDEEIAEIFSEEEQKHLCTGFNFGTAILA